MRPLYKNRIFIASLFLFLTQLAGAFAIAAPILVYLRNQYDKSALALELWPKMSLYFLSDFLINNIQAVIVFILSAFVIYILYLLLRTYILGGIYDLIIFGAGRETGTLKEFLARCSANWPGFLKISVLAVPVYAIALFLGFSFGQVLAGMGLGWRVFVMALFLVAASAYLQILRVRMVSENNTSVRNAIRTTRTEIAKSFGRIIIGNISVALIGFIIALILWLILKGVRHYNWSFLTAAFSIIMEQAIILVFCAMQAVRINFNYSVIKRGSKDVVGGTELGGV